MTELPFDIRRPPALHTISAEHNAREVEKRRAAAAQPPPPIVYAPDDFVTTHPWPPRDPVPSAGHLLTRRATAAGMEVRTHMTDEGCTIEGRVPGQRLGFSAAYRRGQAIGAVWYSPEDAFEMMHDDRPDPDAKVRRIVKGKERMQADPKRMPTGLARDHLRQTASRRGLPVSMTELARRIKALA